MSESDQPAQNQRGRYQRPVRPRKWREDQVINKLHRSIDHFVWAERESAEVIEVPRVLEVYIDFIKISTVIHILECLDEQCENEQAASKEF